MENRSHLPIPTLHIHTHCLCNPSFTIFMFFSSHQEVSSMVTSKTEWLWWNRYIKELTDLMNNFSSIQFSRSVISNSLQPHGLQHSMLPCPLSIPRAYSNLCPSSQGCHPTISSSVIPFSSHHQSFPASGSFLLSKFFWTA